MPDVKPLSEGGVAVLVEIIAQLSEARDADAATHQRELGAMNQRVALARANEDARAAEVIALRGQYERASHESENRLAEIRTLAQRVRELEDALDHHDMQVNIRALQADLHVADRKLSAAEYQLEKMTTDREEWAREAATRGVRADALAAERDSLRAESEMYREFAARAAEGRTSAQRERDTAKAEAATWHAHHREAVLMADQLHQIATRQRKAFAVIREAIEREIAEATPEEGA